MDTMWWRLLLLLGWWRSIASQRRRTSWTLETRKSGWSGSARKIGIGIGIIILGTGRGRIRRTISKFQFSQILSNSGNNSTLCEFSLDVRIIGKMFLTRDDKDLRRMCQPRNKLVQHGRQVEGGAVWFQESSKVNKVNVVLIVLRNSVSSKLNRWSTNQKIREPAKGWMIISKNLKERRISITRILIKDSPLRWVLLEDICFGHTNPDVTSPIWNAWLENAGQVILDRAGGINSKNFRYVDNFGHFGNTGYGNDSMLTC